MKVFKQILQLIWYLLIIAISIGIIIGFYYLIGYFIALGLKS